MPTYLMLTSLTEKGTQTLNSNPARLREVNRDVEELGAKVLHQWASLGEYDFVNVVEAPDELTMANLSVKLGARGSVKFETLTLSPWTSCWRRSRRSRVHDITGSLARASSARPGRTLALWGARARALRSARSAACSATR